MMQEALQTRSSRKMASLRLRLLCVAFSAGLGTICFSSLAADPPAPPIAKPDARLATAIGRAAYDAIENIPDSMSAIAKTQLLINLAITQIRVGDLNGARHALAKARSISELSRLYAPVLFVQSILAEDTDGAMSFIQEASDDVQLRAFEALAEAQIKNADLAGAAKTIALIDALRSKTPRDAAPQAWSASPSQPRSFQTEYDYTLAHIGKAFAAKGDTSSALALVEKISSRGSRSILLAEIAKAQHKAGNKHGADASLRRLKEDADAYFGKAPDTAAFIVALAFGLAGDIDGARAIIAALPLKEDRDRLYSRLSVALARDGDIVHAREIAVMSDDPDDLILIGGFLQRAGSDIEARTTFIVAYNAIKQRGIERLIRLGKIVDGLISAGAFSDALAISAEMDELNRTPLILKAITEEARRGDIRALRETAPIALKLIERARMPLKEKDLTDLVSALTNAGLVEEAQTARSLAGKNTEQLRLLSRTLLTPERQKLKEVEDDIARHDLAAATTRLNSLSGKLKDAGLEHLARAQANAGQPNVAFVTAKGIVDPAQRASTLTGIIDAANKTSP